MNTGRFLETKGERCCSSKENISFPLCTIGRNGILLFLVAQNPEMLQRGKSGLQLLLTLTRCRQVTYNTVYVW